MTTLRRATNKTRRLRAVAGLSLALMFLLSATGLVRADQVMDLVPSDALVVLKINKLQDTSTKLAGLLQALGITDFVPMMSDPLGAFQAQTGLSAGIDKASDAAAVLMNGDMNAPQPPLLLLIPVSDYKAFLGGVTVVKTEGDVTTIHFKDQEQDGYAANWGSYAALSPLKDAVSKKPAGLKVAGVAANELTSKDAVVYVNWPAVKTLLLPKLQSGREQMIGEIDKAFARNGWDTAKSPLAKAAANEALDIAQGFLEQSQATTWGLSISKAGINSTMLTDFLPGTYAGNVVSQVKGTDQTLLNGLPSSKYLFYGGGINHPEVGVKVYDDLTAPIIKELPSLGAVGPQIQDVLASYREAMASSQRATFGMVAPNPATANGLFQIINLYKGDAEKLKAAQIKQVQTQPEVMQALGVPASQAPKTTVTPAASEVDGVKFDEMKMAFDTKGKTPQEMQQQQIMAFMYGPNGFIMRSGVIDPKTLLTVAGGTDDLVKSAVAAAKADTDNLSGTDAVKAVDAELPKNRVAVLYVPLDAIVSTAVGYAGKFGFPVPVQLPPNLPPIGVTVGTDGNAVRVDSHVPTQLVQSLIQAGMQVYLQMRGGQGGGAGGAGGL
jgi:hypothetical protein